MSSFISTDPHLAQIEPPDQPLSLFPLLRTVLDNPIKVWPRPVYRDRLYRWRVLGQDTVYVMAPDLIRTVLLDDADSFEKGEIARRTLGPGLGDSILIADGSRWRWQRRAVATLFRPERIREFLPEMVAAAERTRDRWHAMPPGAEIDVAHEMMRTTFDVILRTMLPGRGNIDTELMERSVTSGLESTSWIVALALVLAPSWVPYPGIYRTRRDRKRLHSILETLILEARQTPGNGDDLLSHLMNATNPETGRSMNTIDVRNNLMTFITAGHETTALALTWTLYLLSLNPEIEERVRGEIAAVTGGGRVRPSLIDELVYTNQVIQESMRLYPPAALIARAARRDIVLDNEQIRAGSAPANLSSHRRSTPILTPAFCPTSTGCANASSPIGPRSRTLPSNSSRSPPMTSWPLSVRQPPSSCLTEAQHEEDQSCRRRAH